MGFFVQRSEKVDFSSNARLSRAKSHEGMRISGDASEFLMLGVRSLVWKSARPKS